MVAVIVLNKEGPYPDGEIESVSPPGSGPGQSDTIIFVFELNWWADANRKD
jgi:hypothetical protein